MVCISYLNCYLCEKENYKNRILSTNLRLFCVWSMSPMLLLCGLKVMVLVPFLYFFFVDIMLIFIADLRLKSIWINQCIACIIDECQFFNLNIYGWHDAGQPYIKNSLSVWPIPYLYRSDLLKSPEVFRVILMNKLLHVFVILK